MARILTNQNEFKQIANLRNDLEHNSYKLGYSKYTGKLTYMIKDSKTAQNFYNNKTTNNNDAEVIFYFWGDKDSFQTNGMQYKTTETMFWHWTTVEHFHSMMFNYPILEYEVYSITSEKCPKITKPKELRGIKPIASIPYIDGKSKCQVFTKGSDVWVKHTDYFSPIVHVAGLTGAPLSTKTEALGMDSKSKKFIYGDSWGAIVQRVQAWIKIKNLNNQLQLNLNEANLSRQILHLISEIEKIPYNNLFNTNMSRFWEDVIKIVKNN